MDRLTAKVGRIQSYFPNGRQGAVIEFYNDARILEKATFQIGDLFIDGKRAYPPITDRVAIGDTVTFDAVPNERRNSWNVTWLASSVRKGCLEEAKKVPVGPITVFKGRIVHVEPTSAVISFLTSRGEENCAFMLGSESLVNGVQVIKGLDDFLDRNTGVDFAARPTVPTVVGSKRYMCKWVTNAIFAENVEVPRSHEAPKLVVGDQWVRATVISVINERRAVVQFTHPDSGQKVKAVLIQHRFQPITSDLRNVMKTRDELEITFEDHVNPMNPEGCLYFCSKAKVLSRAVKEAERAAAEKAAAEKVAAEKAAAEKVAAEKAASQKAAAGKAEAEKVAAEKPQAAAAAAPAVPILGRDVLSDLSFSGTPSPTPPIHSYIFNTHGKPTMNGFTSPSPPLAQVLSTSKADVSTRLVLNLLKTSPLEFIWDNAELLKEWLEQHPLHKTYVELLIVEKYQQKEKQNNASA